MTQAIAVLSHHDLPQWLDTLPAPRMAFAPDTMQLLSAFGEQLRREARLQPELVALGFWLRPANLQRLALRYQTPGIALRGRGTIFHVVPGNVATVPLYSAFTALLAGNSSLVRLSSRNQPLAEWAIARWHDVAAASPTLQHAIRFVRYDHDDHLTAAISRRCQGRLVWGGDASVAHLRQIPLAVDAVDIGFPDRRSAALLDAAWLAQLDLTGWQRFLKQFAADALSFGQQACASPRWIFWLGPERIIERLRRRLWAELPDVAPELALTMAEQMDRWVELQALCAHGASRVADPLMARVETVSPLALPLHAPGVFVEVAVDAPHDLLPHLCQPWQSMACAGVNAETIQALALRPDVLVDHWVALGQALAFDPVWDGHDLIRSLSRQVRVEGCHG